MQIFTVAMYTIIRTAHKSDAEWANIRNKAQGFTLPQYQFNAVPSMMIMMTPDSGPRKLNSKNKFNCNLKHCRADTNRVIIFNFVSFYCKYQKFIDQFLSVLFLFLIVWARRKCAIAHKSFVYAPPQQVWKRNNAQAKEIDGWKTGEKRRYSTVTIIAVPTVRQLVWIAFDWLFIHIYTLP